MPRLNHVTSFRYLALNVPGVPQRGNHSSRHHHERRHRTHGHEPAPRPLDLRDHAAGRRQARQRTPIMPEPILVGRNAAKARSARAEAAASSAGPPISTRRSPTRTTRSTSMRRPPSAAPPMSRRRSPPASTSTARSRSPPASPMRSNCYRLAEKAGVKHGVVQDKLWLPGLLKLKTLMDAGFFGRILSRARRIRLLGLRRRHGSPRSGPRGTTARKTAAASSSTCSATGATCSTTCSAR